MSQQSPAQPSRAGKKKAAVEAESIDQIRDILFGAEADALRNHVEQLDRRLNKAIADTGAEAEKRAAELHGSLEALQKSLEKTRTDEQQARKSQLEKHDKQMKAKLSALNDSVRDANKSLKALGTQFQKQLDAVQADLEASLAAESASLRDTVNAVATRLQDTKVSRIELADMLVAVATQLNPAAQDEFE